ncbi:MAG: hypothetical protein HZA48_01830 [Planctomycetes bacterium]|nr:hypothetical protein [Planctomycetota bacterium]
MAIIRLACLSLAMVAAILQGILYAGPDYLHYNSDTIFYLRSDQLGRVLSRNVSQKSDAAIVEDIRVDLEFNDRLDPLKTKAFISLGTDPLNSEFSDPAEWGLDANRSVIGRPMELIFREAYIEVRYPAENTPFAEKTVFFKAGIQDLRLPLRNSQAFFINLSDAESAFLSPVTESFKGSAYQGRPLDGSAGAGIYRDTFLGDAGGFKLTFSPSPTAYIDLFSFNVMETIGDRADEKIYGINFDYHFGRNAEPENLANAVFAVISGEDARIYTLGGGIDYFWNDLEFYSEGYLQGGKYGELAGEGIEQDAYAYYFGSRFKFSKFLNFYLDASYWTLSGDNGDLSGADMTNRDFVSYEGVNTTMIMEDNLFGLDIDSNYDALKLEFGISGRLKNKLRDDFKLALLYGSFRLAAVPERAGLADGAPDWEFGNSLGNEVDLVFMWRYRPSFIISTGFGAVWDAEFFAATDSFDVKSDKMNLWFLKFSMEF